MEEIKKILNNGSTAEKRSLFAFTIDDTEDSVIFKFGLWMRYFFPQYLKSDDAPFHDKIDRGNFKIYSGKMKSFVNIAFRGGAKTARTKLFLSFCVCNDTNNFRKYIKIIAEDGSNSRQISTDIYNMLISDRLKAVYPEVFEKTKAKREETMGSFTTSTGVKVVADIVGTDQRGAIQEDSRPDFVWFEDFENRKTLRSAVKSIGIWDNMEEARTGLSKEGGCIYTCNYISEQGNVHKLVTNKSSSKILLIVPIEDKEGNPTWSRYSKSDIQEMRENDDDFSGERMCEPSASKDIYFDRDTLDNMEPRKPIKETAGLKVFYEYDPSHRLGGGHDVSGGVGLDSSTSVYIDFDTVPARVVGTFAANTIKPEAFGYEIVRENDIFGGCIEAIENNYGTEAILVCKQKDVKLHMTETKDNSIRGGTKSTYGWSTNALTKPKMLAGLAKAVTDGLLNLSDEALIQECKSYTRNDLIENIKDPRLTTRHFDLLIAAAIAWQMKDYAEVSNSTSTIDAQKNYIQSLRMKRR